MLTKTKVIVLNTVKYSESSLIVNVYSAEYGAISLIAKGVRKSGKAKKSALFSPLNILNLDFDFRENRDLQFFRDAEMAAPLFSLQTMISKSTVSLFLAEFLLKALKEEESNKALFQFLEESIIYFNSLESNYSDFHLVFLIHISRYLGFKPNTNRDEINLYFNLQQGSFQSNFSSEEICLNIENSTNLQLILNSEILNLKSLKFSNKERRELLSNILRFYEIHLPEVGKIESLYILESVFS